MKPKANTSPPTMNTNNEGEARTPRTDRETLSRMPNHVPVSFARQLERELAKMTAERDIYKAAQKTCQDCETVTEATLRARLTRAEELLGEARKAMTQLIDSAQIDEENRWIELLFEAPDQKPLKWSRWLKDNMEVLERVSAHLSAHPSTPPK